MENTFQGQKISILLARAALLKNIRTFFEEKNVLEVETPILSPFATTDVFIDSFSTSQFNKNYYLHTSPEFAMKYLLASGSGDIYQIAKVFRQEESGHLHSPEFSLLEWYRIHFNEQDLITEVGELVNSLYFFQQQKKLKIERISYADLFIKHLGVNPHNTNIKTLARCLSKHNIKHHLNAKDEVDRWLELLMCELLEKHLGGSKTEPKMTFLYDYPASQAALSRVETNLNGEKIAKRFELYIAGVEIANGFYELTDAKEQQQRFNEDNSQRKALGKKTLPYDKNLIQSLKKGLPECAGVALGIDRLLMLLLNKSHINELIITSF